MADSVRGDASSSAGSVRGNESPLTYRAPLALERDPLRLDHERERFNRSPPLYRSSSSGSTTRSNSPDLPSEEKRLHRERQTQMWQENTLLAQRRMKLFNELEASKPYSQFNYQVEEEMERQLRNADPRPTLEIIKDTFRPKARETVKKCWVEQGIWNDKLSESPLGWWNHERPLELQWESETGSETDSEPEPLPISRSIFSFSPKAQPKPRLPKSDDEKRQIAERRVVRERENEASRPYYQFVYQISKERESIQEESANREGANAADINTRAYENVKNTWTQQAIWDTKWSILPGMSWKHEQPDLANPVANGRYEAGEAIIASGALNPSQPEPPADIDPAGLKKDDAERSSSTSNSPPPSSGRRVLRSATERTLLPSKTKGSLMDGQPANASLGPAHSSKVSKAAGKRKAPPRRRLEVSPEVFSEGLTLSSGVDATEPQPSPPAIRVTRLPSKEIQPPAVSVVVANDAAKTDSTNRSKRVLRSKTERKGASNLTTKSPAKPEGVSKAKSATITRGKIRKT